MTKILKHLNQQAGLTMIEILVGVILLGITGSAITVVITRSGKGASEAANISTQNGKLRNTMNLIQAELSDADKPLVSVNTSLNTNPAAGNSIIFSRTAKGSAGKTYLAEKIAYVTNATNPTECPSSKSPCLILQVAKQNTAFADNNAIITAANNAPAKILMDKAVAPTATDPLFEHYIDANTPVDSTGTAWISRIGLVNITLLRDQDGTGNDYQRAKLKSSVFLQKLGSKTQGFVDVCN